MYHTGNVQKCTLLVEVMIMQLFLVRPVFFFKKNLSQILCTVQE